MNVNDVVLYGVIVGAAALTFLSFRAHRQQKNLMHKLRGSKERLVKLVKLTQDVEKVENEMAKAAVEKVDKRNLDLIMRETIDFLEEKNLAVKGR